jgi:flavin reductase (DIM6/NTAB) family NADH-FMN oxidoreductase RutF
MSPQAFRQLMRMHPAAANIVATGKAPNRTGMTVSAFMSLGVEPPTVVCAINRSALSYAQMAENQVFSVNTLAVHHVELAMLFAGQGGLFGDDRFDRELWDEFDSGSPCLRDAVMSLECRLIRQVEESSHSLMIGEVISGRCNERAAPLLYRDGQWVTTRGDLPTAAAGHSTAQVRASVQA